MALNRTKWHQIIPQGAEKTIHLQAGNKTFPLFWGLLWDNFYFPGVLMSIFLSCGMPRQYFSRLFSLDPWVCPRGRSGGYTLNSLWYIKGLPPSERELLCPPENTCLMTRKESYPLYLEKRAAGVLWRYADVALTATVCNWKQVTCLIYRSLPQKTQTQAPRQTASCQGHTDSKGENTEKQHS